MSMSCKPKIFIDFYTYTDRQFGAIILSGSVEKWKNRKQYRHFVFEVGFFNFHYHCDFRLWKTGKSLVKE